MKTTAIRLEDELYAQLTIVAQLAGQTVTDAIRIAVIAYIEQRKSSLSDQGRRRPRGDRTRSSGPSASHHCPVRQ